MPTDENSRYDRVPIPEEPATDRVQSFVEIKHPYTADEAVLEAQRCLQCAMPFCVQACPIAQDARGYILKIAQRDFDGAAQVILGENPLATTLCKVCYHYCEDACIMHERGGEIAIRQLKRSGMEMGNAKIEYAASAPVHERIAIVGGGPAGLMAAWELGLRGYSATVFESEPVLGGQIGAIPKYHMDGYELELDVARFRQLDVTFTVGARLGRDFTLDTLRSDGYLAIYLALGTPGHNTLGIPGENLPGVVAALDMLEETNRSAIASLGRRVVVIGGGDVAMDAVRSARRLTHVGEVTVVYRRKRDQMPAGHEEVEEAEAEGVEFKFERAPVQVIGRGKVEGIIVRRVQLSAPGPSGRPSIVPVAGSEETIPCDSVVVAVGEKADLAGLPPELDLVFGGTGWPQGKGDDTMTGIDGVFASGGRSVVHAMAAGTRSAVGIDAYLRKRAGASPTPRPNPFGAGAPLGLPAGYGGPTWSP
ncbi:MAG: FAD-dependent oxidoreductase [Thermoplasmata archaeon]|nr:FAD-dependent oxidoreductase [Thermoplasmata archaeon]MCI4356350.1 FAD-dependent oxidoreductase [Thermoplasmata archaeon]